MSELASKLENKKRELEEELRDLEGEYNNTVSRFKKIQINLKARKAQKILKKIDNIVAYSRNYSGDELEEYLEGLNLSFLDEKKFTTKKVAVGLAGVALLGAIGFGAKTGIEKLNENKNTLPEDPDKENADTLPEDQNKDTKIPTSGEEVLMPEGEISQELLDRIREECGQEAVDALLASLGTNNNQVQESAYKTQLTDIYDEDQVYARAEEITEYFDTLSPNQGVKVEDTVDFLNYINGGVVNEVSRESALFVITQIETLMNKEMNYSVDMINKGESGYKPNTTVIDYGKFFIDGSLGQKLATQISLIRSAMILNPESSEKASYAKDFTKLLMNSWYLNGHDEINLYSLETAGMKAMVDKLFLNTGMLAGAIKQDLTIVNPLTDEELTLEYIIGEINKKDCPTELVADNGDIITTYVNKFSYDMEGMVKEAVYNKIAFEENFGKTYKLN
jgi:hypothetical protein